MSCSRLIGSEATTARIHRNLTRAKNRTLANQRDAAPSDGSGANRTAAAMVQEREADLR